MAYKERKKISGCNRVRNESGIILFVVLWAVVILTGIAVGLGKSTGLDLALAKHSIGKAKAHYLAYAGLVYSIDQLRADSEDQSSLIEDTMYFCGRKIDPDISTEDIFLNRKLGSGSFDIIYQKEKSDEEEKVYCGLEDEERKININAISRQTVNVLSELVMLLGFDEETAQTIAYSSLDWKDRDEFLSNNMYGAEDDYYEDIGYHCKNSFFDSKEELLLVRGMTPEVFDKLKDFITIFPKERTARLSVNFNTASRTVLKALARGRSGVMNNTDVSDADSLVDKIIEYRNGGDAKEFTADDMSVYTPTIPLNQKENIIFSSMKQFAGRISQYFHVVSRGHENQYGIDAWIDAIVSRKDFDIVYFKAY